MKDIHGKAIIDYYKKSTRSPLILHNSYGEPEEMPVEVFFREPEDLSELENTAIAACSGSVLDLGAGAGAHALLLQALEFDVTALDNSPGCIETMTLSGMNKVIDQDYQSHTARYDTLLLLMNGIGLAGSLKKVPAFLKKCKQLLNDGGQILVDSSDISYLYEDGLEKPKSYYGDIRYQYEYDGKKDDWFEWVYVDPKTLTEIVQKLDMKIEVLFTDENDQYLAKITID